MSWTSSLDIDLFSYSVHDPVYTCCRATPRTHQRKMLSMTGSAQDQRRVCLTIVDEWPPSVHWIITFDARLSTLDRSFVASKRLVPHCRYTGIVIDNTQWLAINTVGLTLFEGATFSLYQNLYQLLFCLCSSSAFSLSASAACFCARSRAAFSFNICMPLTA